MTARGTLLVALALAAGVGGARVAVGCSFPDYEVASTGAPEAGDADEAGAEAAGETVAEAEVSDLPPSVTITSPSSLSTLTLDPARQFPVAVSFANFLVSSSCGSLPGCGHAHVRIDGDNCNVDGGTWNVEIVSAAGYKAASSATVQAGLAPCRAPMAGRKVVLAVELVKDGHGSLTPPVQDSVFVNVPPGP